MIIDRGQHLIDVCETAKSAGGKTATLGAGYNLPVVCELDGLP